MQPKYDAMYRAIVTSNVDPAGLGRIKAQCPQIGSTIEIRSAEPLNPQEPIPAVGTTVWLGFSGGDITKPFYVTNQAVPATVTTSTFPANPFSGELAFTTDTQALQVWDGSNWQDAYSPWYVYTPTWSGLTSLGTGFTSTGYFQILGRTVTVFATLVGGTGTTLGTANITASLPFTATNNVNTNTAWVGTGRHVPGGGGAFHSLIPTITPNTNVAFVFAYRTTDIAWITPGNASFTWNAGSIFNINITYQI